MSNMIKLSVGTIFLIFCLQYGQTRVAREVAESEKAIPNPNNKRIVCYYTNWAAYRANHKFTVDDINPYLCTHLLYAYADIVKEDNLAAFDPYQDIQLEGYSKFVNLKKENPDLKLILSVGGSKQGSTKFSKIASDPYLRSQFAKNSLQFLKTYGFEGLDIVWKYPNFVEGSSSSDRDNFVKLIKEIKKEFKDDYSISITVPHAISLIERGFDLDELAKYVEFMTVLTYDYHVPTDANLGHGTPLYPTKEDSFSSKLNIDFTIKYYMKKGVDPSKLNLATPLYGVSFALDDPNLTNIGDPVEDEGDGTMERGFILYNQFCDRIIKESWTVNHVNKTAVGPYAFKGKQWIAYDDEEMIRTKARYAKDKNLGGLMFWSIDMDDFKGICGDVKFPLIKAAREEFFKN